MSVYVREPGGDPCSPGHLIPEDDHCHVASDACPCQPTVVGSTSDQGVDPSHSHPIHRHTQVSLVSDLVDLGGEA